MMTETLARVLADEGQAKVAKAIEIARGMYVIPAPQLRAIVMLARGLGHPWARMAWSNVTPDRITAVISGDLDGAPAEVDRVVARIKGHVYMEWLNEEGRDAAKGSGEIVDFDWPVSRGTDFTRLHYSQADYICSCPRQILKGGAMYNAWDGEESVWEAPMTGFITPDGTFEIIIVHDDDDNSGYQIKGRMTPEPAISIKSPRGAEFDLAPQLRSAGFIVTEEAQP